MSDERTVLVCTRRRDLPLPPVKSRADKCRICEEAVWVASSSPKTDEILCFKCVVDLVSPDDDIAPPTRGQLLDIMKARQ